MKVSGFKVPEIYHTFELEDKVEEPVTYIVMEYVHGQTVEAAMKNCSQQEKSHILDQVVKAVKQLLKVRPPDSLRLGPVQRGHLHHPLFTEDGAFAKYKSVDHLQRHFNKVFALPLNIPYVLTPGFVTALTPLTQ
jgi:aminoglycoside phosphotransferase (APT) family kinase protein